MQVVEIHGTVQVTDEIALDISVRQLTFPVPTLIADLNEGGVLKSCVFHPTAEALAVRKEYVLAIFFCLCKYFAKNNIEKDVRVLYQAAQDFVPKDL